MPRKASATVPPSTGERVCCFCGLRDDNEWDYGKFHEHDGITTHYYCLLFSSNMQQKGLDNEGILGFLPNDIVRELKRGRRLVCSYCKKVGATLGCCNTKCKKIFHFPCGLKAGSLHQYFGEFRSYCLDHRPKQTIDDRVLKELAQCETRVCYICYDEVNARDFLGTLWAPCCKKNAWFHRRCVQQLAMSAGYFFRCPLCNNKAEFQRAMLDHGIFIPSQDASWELVPNAFQELLYRHNRCDAERCACPKGREYTGTNAKWELTLCRTCGSQGIHMACGNLKWAEPVWECNECTSILNKSALTESSNMSRILNVTRDKSSAIDDEVNNSDSDISVGYPEIPTATAITSSLVSEYSSYASGGIACKEQRKSPEKRQVSQSDFSTNTKVSLKQNGLTQNHVLTGLAAGNAELPPVTKKPKISSTTVDKDCSHEFSDDEVIIVSGPSRKETPSSLVADRWILTNYIMNQSIIKRTIAQTNHSESSISVGRESKDDEAASGISMATTNAPIVFKLEQPIEIDLSDDESTPSANASTSVNPESTENAVSLVPELNIQISNVTSLPPEVFASVPVSGDRSLNDSTGNCLQEHCSSDDRVVAEPKILDSFVPQHIHDSLKIVRLQCPSSDPSNPNNAILYGLTIPGTNNMVPLIIGPPGIPVSESVPVPLDTPSEDSTLKQPHDEYLTTKLSKLVGPKSRKAAIMAAALKHSTTRSKDEPMVVSLHSSIPEIRSNATTRPIMSAVSTDENASAARLSYSIPLETVVNDHIFQCPSDNKSTDKNDAVDARDSSMETIGLESMTGKAIDLRIVSTKKHAEASHVPKMIGKTVPSKDTLANGVDASHAPQMYTPIQHSSPFPPSNISGAFEASKVSQVYSAVPGANTTWRLNGIPKGVNSSLPNSNADVGPDHATGTTTHLRRSTGIANETETHYDQNSHTSSRNCDGDAGSRPALRTTSDVSTNARSERNDATTFLRKCNAETNGRDWCSTDSGTGDETVAPNDTMRSSEKYGTAECSITIDRGDSADRAGLINKMINLRDLKFTVSEPNIVKMTIYETYRVNISIERIAKRVNASTDLSGKHESDALNDKTSGHSITRDGDVSKNVINDPESHTRISALATSDEYEVSNQSGNRPRNNHATGVTDASSSDESFSIATSRVRDELKENRDPVPTLVHPSKCRLRSAGSINHTMHQLNDQATRTIGDEALRSSPRKVAGHEQPQVTAPSRNSHNRRENACGVSRTIFHSTNEDATARIAPPVRRNENTARKLRTRIVERDEDNEISDYGESAKKRPRYACDEDLYKIHRRENFVTDKSRNENFTYRRSSSAATRKNGMVLKSGKFNDAASDQSRTSQMRGSHREVCCKVSIDLARIRSALAYKLNVLRKTEKIEFSELTSWSDVDTRSPGESLYYEIPRKSRSLSNLTTCEHSPTHSLSIAKTRRWKSSECLDAWSDQKIRDEGFETFDNSLFIENTRRGCKSKMRFSEEHDCLR